MVAIDIIGGGVAGVALAAGLDPKRFEVRLHERAPDRRELATVYGLWPHALRALQMLGVDEQVRACSHPALGAAVSTSAGRSIGRTRAPDDSWLVPRPDLLRVLAEAVPPTVQRFTHAIHDPATLDGDVVVGADGVHSVTRAAAWNRPARRTGAMAFRGVVDGSIEDLVPGQQGLHEFWGRGSLFGISPNTGGRTNWFASTREFRATPEEALEWSRRHFAGFPTPVHTVLKRAEPGHTLVNPIVETPMLRSLVRGRHVLVGDAAHAMSPNLGRGACEALVDAATLAQCLSTLAPADALRAYERRRLVRGQTLRLASGAVRRVALHWP